MEIKIISKMNINKLYDIADKENIPVINFKMQNKAIIGQIGKEYCIGLNYSKIDNSCEEKEILAEELGHYYTGSLYNSSMPFETVSRCENRANKWAYNVLIPYGKLRKAILKGIDNLYYLAEYFDVTAEYMNKAIEFYKGKYGGIC